MLNHITAVVCSQAVPRDEALYSNSQELNTAGRRPWRLRSSYGVGAGTHEPFPTRPHEHRVIFEREHRRLRFTLEWGEPDTMCAGSTTNDSYHRT